MRGIKDLLIVLRNGIAFTFSWLILLIVIASLFSGTESISVSTIIKVFALCVWGVFSFIISFKFEKVTKRGFIFSLTLFYILFIPVEVLLFYLLGMFKSSGSLIQWIIFGIIVIAAYLLALLIDIFVFRKKEKLYTEKIREYIEIKDR